MIENKIDEYMNESRNLKSDQAKIEKMVNKHIIKLSTMEDDLYKDIEKTLRSISKSINKEEFGHFISEMVWNIDLEDLEYLKMIENLGNELLGKMK